MMIGEEIYKFAEKLWPINRSITGPGLRQTLNLIKEHLPQLKIFSIPSGTKVFDWTIPLEWNVSSAYIRTPDGEIICDFNKNNLHLLGYSTPYYGKISLNDLQKHLHSLPNQPDAIPYITSYYKKRWGFCISQNQRDKLKDGEYEVFIKSELFEGELNYGELIIPGDSEQEIFLSTYICHPSMANNELSGPTVLTYLAKWLNGLSKNKYTYRIIFVPETIGSITYLNKNLDCLKRKVFAGFNITCVGDNRSYSYIPSRNGNTISDKAAKHILKWIDNNYISYTWLDRGSDERQYCSPGIDLPIACILRTKYGEYPEYHTSLDDLKNVVSPEGLNGGYWAIRNTIELLENNKFYKVRFFGEPQLGKRGLYPTLSTKLQDKKIRLILNFISFCDGKISLLEIAEKLNCPCWELYEIIDTLLSHKLITQDFNSK